MRTLLVLASLTVVASPAASAAQSPPADARVRISRSCDDCPEITGTVREWSQEQLALQLEGSESLLVVPTSDVTQIEIYRGSYAAEGAMIGLGVAVAAGLLVAATAQDEFLFSAGAQGAIVGIGVGLLTVPVGVLVGRSQWKTRAWPGAFDLAVTPTTAGGLAFGATMRF